MYKPILLPTLMLATALLCFVSCDGSSSSTATAEGGATTSDEIVLRWGTDEIGGAPFMFRDPNDPNKHLGFEKEIADEIGKRLNCRIEFVQAVWDSLIPALNRGDFDFVLSGIEVTDERKAVITFTQPYCVYSHQLVVRKNTNDIQNLSDLKDKTVGTLLKTTSEDILKKTFGAIVRSYEDPQRPYDDLANGQIDAVLLDLPIAAFYALPNKDLKYAGPPIAPGHYAIAVRDEDKELHHDLDQVLSDMKKDGTLKEILQRWNLWSDAQTTGPLAIF